MVGEDHSDPVGQACKGLSGQARRWLPGLSSGPTLTILITTSKSLAEAMLPTSATFTGRPMWCWHPMEATPGQGLATEVIRPKAMESILG